MNVSVIGAGYVGLVTAACFSEFGIHVTCVDKDEAKINSLKKGEMPIYEPGLAEMVSRNITAGRLQFTTDIGSAVETALVIIIAVGTPPRGDGSADLSYVEKVGEEVASHMNSYKVIVTKSTVPVGTGERLRKIIGKNLKEAVDFDMASNPEFLREGSAIEDFMRPNRVVIGATSQQAVAILKDLYRPLYLIETPVVITDIPTAELIKYASNAFLATKISFINEMAELCERVGADIHQVAKGMGLDQRIGGKFLHAGPGFGGSCFPKDTRALIQIAKEKDFDLKIVEAVVRVNVRQRRLMIEKIEGVIGDLKGKRLAFLGLAFKPNTDDIRESPAVDIIRLALEKGAVIQAFDPEAMSESRKVLPEIEYMKDPYDAARGADAVVLATEWNQFRNLDFKILKNVVKSPVFIDLRNVYDGDMLVRAGFRHVGVGRPPVTN